MVHAYTPPYGFKRDEDGLLVPCPAEQQVLYTAKSMRETFKFSYRKIAHVLNEEGFRNVEGKPWTDENIRSLFRRGRMVAVGTPPEADPGDDGVIEVDPRDANKLLEPERTISIVEIELSPEEEIRLLRKQLRRVGVTSREIAKRQRRNWRQVNRMLRGWR